LPQRPRFKHPLNRRAILQVYALADLRGNRLKRLDHDFFFEARIEFEKLTIGLGLSGIGEKAAAINNSPALSPSDDRAQQQRDGQTQKNSKAVRDEHDRIDTHSVEAVNLRVIDQPDWMHAAPNLWHIRPHDLRTGSDPT
jgi:hypothetical protein